MAPRKRKKPKQSVSEASQEIKDRLNQAASKSGHPGKVRVHTYSDGSIDGELSIPVPKGVKTQSLLLDLERAFGGKGMGSGYWLSVGERHVIKRDEEIYRKLRGMNDVQVYYQRATRSKIAINFLTARNMLTPGMEKKFRRKAETVYVRIHWNPDDRKPKR